MWIFLLVLIKFNRIRMKKLTTACAKISTAIQCSVLSVNHSLFKVFHITNTTWNRIGNDVVIYLFPFFDIRLVSLLYSIDYIVFCLLTKFAMFLVLTATVDGNPHVINSKTEVFSFPFLHSFHLVCLSIGRRASAVVHWSNATMKQVAQSIQHFLY